MLDDSRTSPRFHPRLAPFKAAVLPLVNRDGMDDIGMKLYRDLQKEYKIFYDDSGSVGRRYRRQDEIGTPFCLTVDHQTADDDTVTLRHRDSMDQERVKIDELVGKLHGLING